MWEYELLAVSQTETMSAETLKQDRLRRALRERGANGWELVTTVEYDGDTQMIFKRPKSG